MKISGFKKRPISTIDGQAKLAYDVDLYVSNTTGEAYMGLSGYTGSVDNAANSKKLQFTFKSGRIFDPEGRCSSSYKENEIVNIKASFLRKVYDYFIDNTLICSIGSKEDFKIRNFFFDTKGCEISLTKLDIYSKNGALALLTSADFPVFGSSGTSGTGDKSTSGSSGLVANAITFNSGINMEGSILSGEVILGSGDFKFDDSASNLSYLSGVSYGTKKDLRLKSKSELFEKQYPLGLNFYTSFGTFSGLINLEGIDPFNPSGVEASINGESEDIFPIGDNFSLINESGDPMSGEFSINYSASNLGATDKASGLPFKVYLEHVSGDHSKNYSFITGVEISGAGLGYDSSKADLEKSIVFRTGDLAGSSASSHSGSLFGNEVKDSAVGLVSFSTGYDSQITEGHIRSIRTNLHTGASAGSGTFAVASGLDKSLFTSYENVVDIVSIFTTPDSSTAATKVSATGVPMVMSYTKPASDWALFTGSPDSESLTQHTATGIDSTPLRRLDYVVGDETFLRAVVRTKNYVDTDPMVYNLVFSGADGFVSEKLITGTVMSTGYNIPIEPIL
jgi:hypothetical protein